jgi:hypothetical protein
MKSFEKMAKNMASGGAIESKLAVAAGVAAAASKRKLWRGGAKYRLCSMAK